MMFPHHWEIDDFLALNKDLEEIHQIAAKDNPGRFIFYLCKSEKKFYIRGSFGGGKDYIESFVSFADDNQSESAVRVFIERVRKSYSKHQIAFIETGRFLP